MKKYLFFLLIGLSLILAACSGGASRDHEGSGAIPFSSIGPEELSTMLANKDFVMVNVHVPFEGDIPDTDLSIPYNQISQNLDRLPPDKNAKIVVYCRSGSMSNIAAKELASLGYTNIINLDGGFNAWSAAGFPMD